METNVLEERLKFVADYESGQWSMTELCERYGVTRPTGYKWLDGTEEVRGARCPDPCDMPRRRQH
jgi:transposase-like protein